MKLPKQQRQDILDFAELLAEDCADLCELIRSQQFGRDDVRFQFKRAKRKFIELQGAVYRAVNWGRSLSNKDFAVTMVEETENYEPAEEFAKEVRAASAFRQYREGLYRLESAVE